jgi:hypothetical protein
MSRGVLVKVLLAKIRIALPITNNEEVLLLSFILLDSLYASAIRLYFFILTDISLSFTENTISLIRHGKEEKTNKTERLFCSFKTEFPTAKPHNLVYRYLVICLLYKLSSKKKKVSSRMTYEIINIMVI